MSSKRNWVLVTIGLAIGGIVGIAFGMATIFGLDLDLIWESLIAIACLVIFLGVGAGVSLLLVRTREAQEALKVQRKRNADNEKTLGQYSNEQEKKDQRIKTLESDLNDAHEEVALLGWKLDLAAGKFKGALDIPRPFKICVVGETVNDGLIKTELRSLFDKHGLKASEWGIDYVNNSKLRKTDVSAKLKRGRSKFNLVVTGQIQHHSTKKDDKQNLLTKLKREIYIDCIVGSHPTHPLTVDDIITKLDNYLYETFGKKD